MLMEPKTKQKMASSAIDGGGKNIEYGVEEVKNTEALDHWDFLDEIEAPMWADLSLRNLTNEETDDPWFHVIHPFHQCSSSELLSDKEGGSNSISIQEPPSPKIPPSVSKSRGKSYKIKEWGQGRNKATFNKQHPVKSLNRKSSGSAGSSNTAKSISRTGKLKQNEDPKASSSCESGLTNPSRPKFSKSHSSSLARQEQEEEQKRDSSSMSTVTSDHSDHQQKKGLEVSSQTLSQTSGLLSSLRINLRKSFATRPAARVLVNGGRRSEGSKSSSKSSVGSSLDQGSVGKKLTLVDAQNKARTPDSINVTRISQPPRNKFKVPSVTKAPALNFQNLSKRQGNDTLASKVTAKGKVQQHTSRGKALMPRNVNEQYQMINKETEKVGVGKRPAFLTGFKETSSTTMATNQKSKSSDKAAQSMGHVQKASKQNVAQKNDSKKLIGLKEKTDSLSRDKKTVNPTRKVYFR